VVAVALRSRDESPYRSDQAEMFAKGAMKRVAFTPADVDAQTVKLYNPGVEP